MRIISGRFRGKSINPPAGLPVRPTTDFAKTGLFNILNNRIDYPTCQLLDLFSGTGNISYEFVSRGCQQITCVDADKRCISFIKKNMQELRFENITLVVGDVLSFLEKCNKPYNLIFADPPYSFPDYETVIRLIFENNILMNDGLLIIEHSSDIALTPFSQYSETRVYGQVAFSFYK